MATTSDLQKEIQKLKRKNQVLEKRLRNIEDELNIEEPVKEEPKEKKQVKKGSDLEEKLGTKLFGKIGILALVIGIGFFIKLALDNNWISHLTQIFIGTFIGLALIVGGQIISRKKEQYNAWGLTLVGGGIAIVYFAVYAAYHFESYRTAIGIPLYLDIILLSIVVLGAVAMSLKNDSPIVAGEAFLLGYVTSFLSNSFGTLTLVYILLLTIGVIFVSAYKNWLLIGLGGFLATYFLYYIWYIEHTSQVFTALMFLTSYFLLFNAQVLFSKRPEKPEYRYTILIMSIVNAIIFGILFYMRLIEYYPEFDALFTIIVSLFYGIMSAALYKMNKKDIAGINIYIALAYLTVTIPLFVRSDYITIVFALEALVLLLIAKKYKAVFLLPAAFIISGITAAKTLLHDSWNLEKLVLSSILESRLFSFAVVIAVFYFCYWYMNKHDKFFKNTEVLSDLYAWAASGFLVIIIFLEGEKEIISPLLAIFVIVLLVLSFRFNLKSLTLISYFVAAVTTIRLALWDSWRLEEFALDSVLQSSRPISFLTVILIFYVCFIYAERKSKKLPKGKHLNSELFSWFATGLLALILLLEFEDFYISIMWAILGIILLIIGFMSMKKHLRLQGIIVLGITILKVFLYDTRELGTAARTISFIALGIILLAASFFYNKYKDKLKKII